MRHYCDKCGHETEHRYDRTRRGNRNEKREVYRCAVCGSEREYVVS